MCKTITFVNGLPGAGKSTMMLNLDNKCIITEPVSQYKINRYLADIENQAFSFQTEIIEAKFKKIEEMMHKNCKEIYVERYWLLDKSFAKMRLTNNQYNLYKGYYRKIVSMFNKLVNDYNYTVKHILIDTSVEQCLKNIEKRGIESEIKYYTIDNLNYIYNISHYTMIGIKQIQVL